MKLLLDTHVFLWFITADRRLPPWMSQQIRDPGNEVFLSVVSLWEIIVKHQLGKLPLPQPPAIYITQERSRHAIASLSLDEASVSRLEQLPAFHRDPFDRMLICQALAHRLTIATVDPLVLSYPVSALSNPGQSTP